MARPDCEKAVIGGVIIHGGWIDYVRQVVEPEYFSVPSHRQAFEVLCAMRDRREAIDETTASARMNAAGNDKAVSLLIDCLHAARKSDNTRDYARLVAEAHFDSLIVKAGSQIGGSGVDQQLVVDELTRLVLAKQSLTAPPTFDYGAPLHDAIDEILMPKSGKRLKTHFHAVDEFWHGVEPGEVNTWAAATNVGKSMMLLNLAHLAAKNGNRVLYVGTEMSAIETVRRHLSIASGVSAVKLRQNKLDELDLRTINETAGEVLYSMPFHVLDLPEPSLADVDAAINAKKPDVVFLDYLERFTLPREESMRLRVKEFMRKLKNLARQRGVVVHLAAQLNRNAYGMTEARPTLAELSESSAIEKESDRVMLMWTPKDKQRNEYGGNVIEIIQAKNRHGKRGLAFDAFLSDSNLTITEWGKK